MIGGYGDIVILSCFEYRIKTLQQYLQTFNSLKK